MLYIKQQDKTKIHKLLFQTQKASNQRPVNGLLLNINMSSNIDLHEHDIKDILKNLTEHTAIQMQLIESISLHSQTICLKSDQIITFIFLISLWLSATASILHDKEYTSSSALGKQQ